MVQQQKQQKKKKEKKEDKQIECRDSDGRETQKAAGASVTANGLKSEMPVIKCNDCNQVCIILSTSGEQVRIPDPAAISEWAPAAISGALAH